MRLQKLGNNCHTLHFPNGDEVFFSYETPVAGDVDGLLVRTTKKWSVTTSKHINQYLEGRQAKGPSSLVTLLDSSSVGLLAR